MVFVQYYDIDLAGKLSECCGDRAVVVLDGRNSLETMHKDAKAFNGVNRPEYKAYRIYKGESFSRSNPITNIISLTEGEVQ